MPATRGPVHAIYGVDARTGRRLAAPDIAAISRAATGRPVIDADQLRQAAEREHLGVEFGRDIHDPASVGWAVVLPEGCDEVAEALQPLIRHRNGRVLAYRQRETVDGWLARHGVEIGNVRIDRVPYYLLLAGDADRIPFSFQVDLGVEYAVGRLALDSPEDYGRYAAAVAAYESGEPAAEAREIVYFGTRHPNDAATQMSHDLLIGVLAEGRKDEQPIAAKLEISGSSIRGAAATKARLAESLRRDAARILFTATHGTQFAPEDEQQRQAQGALLCADYDQDDGSLRPEHYFAPHDVPDDARLSGTVAFFFACYGAGTPRANRFFQYEGTERLQAPADFVAALPKRLLSHPRGPALAVIGHVDLAWSSSFVNRHGEGDVQPFRNAIGSIASGLPVGLALRDFNGRYAALSTLISSAAEQARRAAAFRNAEPRLDDDDAWRWMMRNDAGAYVTLGDPAVRWRRAAR